MTLIRKIALIGNGGAGKSTVAAELHRKLGLPLHVVDSVQSLPGWERQVPQVVELWHEEILNHDAWIIDGWGSMAMLQRRFELADRVLLFDYPLEIHLASARKREAQSQRGECAYEPPGCRYADIPDLMEATLRRVDSELMPQVRAMLSPFATKVISLRGFDDLEGMSGRL